MVGRNRYRSALTLSNGLDPPAIVSALTKALCRVSLSTPLSRPKSGSSKLTDPDINRLSPPSTHSSSLTATDSSLSQLPQDRIEPRILIINATPGSQGSTASASGNGNGNENEASGGGRMRGGYVGLMNCVFAAQKAVSLFVYYSYSCVRYMDVG
jgi:transcription initiation factor TFIIH subunit 3